jgi:ferredoxin
MRPSVIIDAELCIGATECTRIAPAAFRLDEERGVSVVLEGAAAVDEDTLREAVRDCPTEAISMIAANETASDERR